MHLLAWSPLFWFRLNKGHVTMQISANGLHIFKQALFNCFLSGAHFFLPVKTIGFFRPFGLTSEWANSRFFYVVRVGFFFLLSTYNQAIWTRMDSRFMLSELVARLFWSTNSESQLLVDLLSKQLVNRFDFLLMYVNSLCIIIKNKNIGLAYESDDFLNNNYKMKCPSPIWD